MGLAGTGLSGGVTDSVPGETLPDWRDTGEPGRVGEHWPLRFGGGGGTGGLIDGATG